MEFGSDSRSEHSSFAQSILSTTEESENGLSEDQKRKRTDPQLLKAIPDPDLSSVFCCGGRGEG